MYVKNLHFCQTPVLGLGLGVDFVLPLSQQQEQEEQEEPHQNLLGGRLLQDYNMTHRLN